MPKRNKIISFLGSMRFAVILLGILAAASAVGSFIPQGMAPEWYASSYSREAAALISLFHLEDVFHSWWYLLIAVFLCINLLMCNLLRIPLLIRKGKELARPGRMLSRLSSADAAAKLEKPGHFSEDSTAEQADREKLSGNSLPGRNIYKIPSGEKAEQVFRHMGFRKIGKGTDGEGRPWLFARKNGIGIWGAWLTHLGVFLLIAAFSLGQLTKEEYTVYGLPGQTKPVGDTGLQLTIDDFQIGLREDDTVDQYTSQLTAFREATGETKKAAVSVNHPGSMFGMRFYQNSTGWAADIAVLKNGEEIQRETVCAGEPFYVEDKEGLEIHFVAFYPDFYMDPADGPMTMSSRPDNPAYLYRAVYQDQVIGMNVLQGDDVITIDEYTVVFSNPQNYTLIQVKRDRFTIAALIGGLLIAAALLLSFYVQPAGMAAVDTGESWLLTGECPRGGVLFDDRLKKAVEVICFEGKE